MSKVMSQTPVLVVDDDAGMRKALYDVLVMEGYRVQTAASGKQALAYLHTEPTGRVVVLDYQMPDMTGAEVLSRVLASPALARRLTFVMVTASEQLPTDFVTLLASRNLPLIRKPFDADQLLASVAEAAICIEALMTSAKGAAASGGAQSVNGTDGANDADGTGGDTRAGR